MQKPFQHTIWIIILKLIRNVIPPCPYLSRLFSVLRFISFSFQLIHLSHFATSWWEQPRITFHAHHILLLLVLYLKDSMSLSTTSFSSQILWFWEFRSFYCNPPHFPRFFYYDHPPVHFFFMTTTLFRGFIFKRLNIFVINFLLFLNFVIFSFS